jgi:hypothetical protein
MSVAAAFWTMGCADLFAPAAVAPTQKQLSVPTIAQQTEVWCWAASAEMILRYYQMPNLNPGGDYQCGVVGTYYHIAAGPNHPCASISCYQCISGASTMWEIARVLDGYGQVARQFGLQARVLSSSSATRRLSLAELAIELDEGRPILAGVSFHGGPSLPGISGHAVVIVGYDAMVSAPTITINDPYPYERFVPYNQNPYIVAGGRYVSPGKYTIELALLDGPIITWGNTIYQIQ